MPFTMAMVVLTLPVFVPIIYTQSYAKQDLLMMETLRSRYAKHLKKQIACFVLVS